MEEEEAPTLRLVMLEGPRKGESLDFPPGGSVRIGRVVRGNSLTIKDSGISSKHVSIVTESSKWLVRDLDSSNGTVLDGSKIPPHTPFPLHHDSIIKIGEYTSIHVTFLPHQPHTTHVRRNRSRRGRPKRGEENVEKKKTKGASEKRELLEETCERRENENLNGGNGNWPDLKNMSLGEWFDFLQVHLPKQIIDTTEDMIESMTQKADTLRNYIIQQQNVHG